MELFVFGNESTGQILLVAALDNLGKGAAGAAVQNINLMPDRRFQRQFDIKLLSG